MIYAVRLVSGRVIWVGERPGRHNPDGSCCLVQAGTREDATKFLKAIYP